MSETTMPFGKHKGVRLDDLEASYLDWLATKADLTSERLRAAVAAEVRRRAETPNPEAGSVCPTCRRPMTQTRPPRVQASPRREPDEAVPF